MKYKYIQNFLRVLTAGLFTGFPVILSGQTNSDGSRPQYLFPEFSKCEVRMKNGQIQSSVMNYNIVTERMVFSRDNKYYDMTNPEIVDTILLNDSKFVPSGKIFYEVLLSGGPVDLFIQNKGDLLPAGKPVGYGGTSQLASSKYLSTIKLSSGEFNLELPADYTVKAASAYWIRRNNEMLSFTNEKQYLKLFPDKAEGIKEYIKKNRLKFDRYADMIQIVRYSGGMK
ncbi:MAG: hypothetical protein MUO72_06505 [Bacteroidales bacterium]|nr:hypothetical protein [Bacteroidales bacterium]